MCVNLYYLLSWVQAAEQNVSTKKLHGLNKTQERTENNEDIYEQRNLRQKWSIYRGNYNDGQIKKK